MKRRSQMLGILCMVFSVVITPLSVAADELNITDTQMPIETSNEKEEHVVISEEMDTIITPTDSAVEIDPSDLIVEGEDFLQDQKKTDDTNDMEPELSDEEEDPAADGKDIEAVEEEKKQGWYLEDDGNYYYYDLESGEKIIGWLNENDHWYFMEPGSGAMKTGWQRGNGGWYYFDLNNGSMRSGWVKDAGKWYYMNPNTGLMQTGWLNENDHWYFMEPGSGAMKTGWLHGNSGWYYFDPNNGSMRSGWVKDTGRWYYLNSDTNLMQTGWLNESGRWYFLDTRSGAMKTGWVRGNGAWYFLDRSSGKMRYGWVKDAGKWYYMDPSTGSMQTGWWPSASNKKYYLQGDGSMATGSVEINGQWNDFDANGVWQGVSSAMIARAQRQTSATGYLMLVSKEQHDVGVFTKSGNSWKLYKKFKCSIGEPGMDTPSGVFAAGSKQAFFDSGSVRCFYATQITGPYLFHTVLYNQSSTVENRSNIVDGRLGVNISHGCVRLATENALWVYNNIPAGTRIVVY